MRSEPLEPALRVGGTSIAPGQARTVLLTLPGRPRATTEDDALPVHVAAGRRPGPRLTVLGAPRGFEVAAVAAATAFADALSAPSLEGNVLVVPLLRPGGRFSAGGRPVRAAAAWHFPGDAAGSRRERDAFTVFSETCAGATAIVLLTAPAPGQSGLSIARGDLDDPHFRRLALQAGLDAVVHVRAARGSLAAAARETGTPVIELVATSCESTPAATATLLRAIRRLGEAIGFASGIGLPARSPSAAPTIAAPAAHRCPTFSRVMSLAAECGGLAEIHARPGQTFRHGEPLARITPLSLAPPVLVPSPRDALVLECPTARSPGVRRGANLFRLAIGPRATRAGASGLAATDVSAGTTHTTSIASSERSGGTAPPSDGTVDPPRAEETAGHPTAPLGLPHELRVGWVERISLPLLGISRLKAKVDTGARTSALHVAKMRPVGTASGPHRRPILELTIPHGAAGGKRSVVVRAPVRDYVQVKDTSGRSERRPVIVTTFRLGDVERRIRVTLTDRADMLFPMLIGRTALGTGVIVDPARRYLVRETPRQSARRPKTTRES